MANNEEKPKIQFNIDTNLYAISNVNIIPEEEHFLFLIYSGNQVRRFLAMPKHAKRIFLLLQKQIAEYEKKFGELKTQLPEKKGTTEREEKMGFGQ